MHCNPSFLGQRLKSILSTEMVEALNFGCASKIIFSEKSLSVHVCPSVRPSVRPVPSPSPSLSPKKVIETENFAKKSYQIHYKGDKNTSRVVLPLSPPLLPLLHAPAAAAAAATKTTAFLGKAKPSYVYSTQFRVSSPLQSWSKAVVCASTPRKYPRSGYFLVMNDTGQMRPIIQLECAAIWAIWGDSDYYGDPQIMGKSSF